MMTNEAGESIFSTYIELLDKFGVLTRAVTQVRSTETWEALKTATVDVAGCLDEMARAAGFDLKTVDLKTSSPPAFMCVCTHPMIAHSDVGCQVGARDSDGFKHYCACLARNDGDWDSDLSDELSKTMKLTPSTQDGDGVTDAVYLE